MTAVNLGVTFSNRTAAQTAQVLVKNLILEQDDTNLITGRSYISRPGLATWPFPSTNLFRGVFQQDGLFSGDFLVVGGGTLYRFESGAYVAIGTIAGGDLISWASSSSRLMICGGATAYIYDGASLTAVTMPSGEQIGWVCYLSGYFLLGVLNSQHIFFLVDGNTTPDALDYFSAETNAGSVLWGSAVADQLVLSGQKVTEFWQASGNSDLPYSRIVGSVYQRGVIAKYAACICDNTLFFVGDDTIVYRADAVPLRISTNSIEEKIRKSAAAPVIWSFSMDGHAYLVMTISGWTFVYDASCKSWYDWQSRDDATWAAQYGTQINGGVVVAGTLGKNGMMSISSDLTDDFGAPITREITGGVAVLKTAVRCDNFTVLVDSGGSTTLGADMAIDLCWSDDQANTWSAWVTMDAGAPGQYSAQPVAKMLGLMKSPGRIFHIRCAALGPFRVSYARVNEYSGV